MAASGATDTFAFEEALECASISTTIPATGHVDSPLFRLPSELRLEICGYIFKVSTALIAEEHVECCFRACYPSSPQALTQVCRAVRQDTLPLYFSMQRHALYNDPGLGRSGRLFNVSRDKLEGLDDGLVASLRVLRVECLYHRNSPYHMIFHVNLRRSQDWVTAFWARCSELRLFEDAPEREEVEEVVKRVFRDGHKVVMTVERVDALFKALHELLKRESRM